MPPTFFEYAQADHPVSWDDLDPQNGDLFLFCVNTDGNGNITTTPTGLHRLDGDFGGGAGMEAGLFYSITDGTETGTIYTDGADLGKGNPRIVSHIYRLRAADWGGADTPEFTKSAGGNDSGGTDPPDLTPAAWAGSNGTHWFAIYGRDDNDGLISGPSGYDPPTETFGGGFELVTTYTFEATNTKGASGWSFNSGEGYASYMLAAPGAAAGGFVGWGIPVGL